MTTPTSLQAKVILLALTLFGAFLRIYNLSFQCFWTEEQYTISMAKMPFLDILTHSFGSDFNPPLFYFISHVSMLLSGFSDISIRYPSVICGIALIPIMFILGKTYKDEIAGLYCAGFTTILFPLIYYSQYGRAYEMSVLFFAITLIFYIKAKRDNEYELAFWITASLNIWIHLFSIIPIGMMALDVIISKKKLLFPLIASAIVSPLSLMFLSVIHNRTPSGSSFSYGASVIQMIVLTPLELFNTLFLNFIFFTGVGWYLDKSRLKNRLAFIAIATIIIGIACSPFTPFFPRYYMTVSLIFVLLTSVAFVNLAEMLPERIRYKYIIFSMVFFIFLWMEIPNFFSHYQIQQYVCDSK